MSSAARDLSVWYIARAGQQYGPLSELELQKLVELNHLRSDDFLWRDGFPNWMEAHRIPGLISPPPHQPQPTLREPAAATADLTGAATAGVTGAATDAEGDWQSAVARAYAAAAPAPEPGTVRRPGAMPSAQPWPAAPATGFRPLPAPEAVARPGFDAGVRAPEPTPETPAEAAAPADNDTAPIGLAMASYVCLLLAVPPLPLIGIVIAAVNRNSLPEWLASHYKWQLQTVLKGVLFLLIGALSFFLIIGVPILIATTAWAIGRHIKGISLLSRRQPIANPGSWTF